MYLNKLFPYNFSNDYYMKIDLVFLIVLGIVVAYIFVLHKVESMADVGSLDQIKEAVKQVYLADVEAIRNLSNIASKLTATGLTVPGQLKVADKISTNNLDPNNMPDGWGGGLRIFDGYSSGTIGFGPDGKKLNAYMNANGDVRSINLNTDNAVINNRFLAQSGDFHIPIIAKSNVDSHIQLTTKNDDNKNVYLINRDGHFRVHHHGVGDILEINRDKNTRINSNLVLQNQDIRISLPVILNFTAPDIDHSYFHRTFTINNQSFITILWQDGNGWDRFRWFQGRMKALGRDWRANVRHLEDFRRFTNITLTVPPGKIAKFYGWQGEFKKFGPGFYQEILPFSPHVFWAGWAEFDGDFPDNMHIGNRTGI